MSTNYSRTQQTHREEPLTEIQKDFIPHVLEHVYPDAAAKRCGIDPHTAMKWMQQATFRAELERQRKLMARNVALVLEKYANQAVRALADMLTEQNDNDALRIKAADSILSHAIKYREFYELEGKIEQIEEIADEVKQLRDSMGQA